MPPRTLAAAAPAAPALRTQAAPTRPRREPAHPASPAARPAPAITAAASLPSEPRWESAGKRHGGGRGATSVAVVTIRKGGEHAAFSEAAFRLILGLGETQALPRTVRLRVLFDRQLRLVAFRPATESESDSSVMACSRMDASGRWQVGLGTAVEALGLRKVGRALRNLPLRSFANGLWGISISPEVAR